MLYLLDLKLDGNHLKGRGLECKEKCSLAQLDWLGPSSAVVGGRRAGLFPADPTHSQSTPRGQRVHVVLSFPFPSFLSLCS